MTHGGSGHLAMKTLGQLKLSLIQNGIYIPPDLRPRPEIARGCYRHGDEEEIVIALGEDFFVRAHTKSSSLGNPKIQVRDDGLWIDTGQEQAEAAVVPLPEFIRKRQDGKGPASRNVLLDGYCLNVFLRRMRKVKLNMAVEDVLSVIRAAFEEAAADLVQINMDYCPEDDRGFDSLAPLIGQIKKHFSSFISLRGFPPRNPRDIDKIYAAGVDLLNYPLEGFGHPKQMERILPAKEILEGLKYAVDIFPQGAVSTELIFGSGSMDLAKEKIDLLSGKGILPLLKLPGRHGRADFDFGRIAETSRHLAQAAQREKLNLKWLYPACQYVTPLDAAFFTESPAPTRLAVKPVYQSKIGKRAFEGFAALRRRLRVKNISDSYESAGL